MSKERDLLERHCNWKLSPDEHLKLLKETKELLAQPEQTEQEPVATKLESHQFTAFHVSAGDFKKLQKLPTGTKIYTAPPKREPFGPEERQRLSKAYSTRAEQVAFEEGIIFAKILFGIGGGE